MPQLGQATCGSLGARQRSQVASVGAVAFQFARRARVLLRDILRLGTATVVISCPVLLVRLNECFQRRPTGVDVGVLVLGIVRQSRAALGAQTGAVLLAQRLER